MIRSQLRTEFSDLTTGPKAIAAFRNPKAAFRLLDLDDVEIDDGEIIGLDDAIKELAEDEPYLLVKEREDKAKSKARRRSTGQKSGTSRKRGNPNRDKLLAKYPALRR